MTTKLSEHFSLEEFLRSEYAARRGIDMTPPADVKLNLERLAVRVLEPIRAHVCTAVGRDVSLFVTSGYRPHELNALVGGKSNSDHLYGRAADFVAIGVPFMRFAELVRQACESLDVRQCIREFDHWMHIGMEPYGTVPRREYLIARRDAGRTVYSPWPIGVA